VNPTHRSVLQAGSVLVASVALVWSGGPSAALASFSPPGSAPVQCTSPVDRSSPPVQPASTPADCDPSNGGDTPVSSASPPDSPTNRPVGQSSAPVGDTSAPVGDTSAPVEDVTPPVGDTSAPVGDASAPVEDVSPPVGDASPPVGDASAPTPTARACTDFPTQAAAQAALAASPTDPEQLDADKDGIACEDRFQTQGQQVTVHPSGPVATGGYPSR
jgi:hypothetical protein